MKTTRNRWRKITSFRLADKERVDLWLYIYASPRSMGISDAFKVEAAWREKGKWLHMHMGEPTEIYEDYITHFAAIPSPESPPKSPSVDLW